MYPSYSTLLWGYHNPSAPYHTQPEFPPPHPNLTHHMLMEDTIPPPPTAVDDLPHCATCTCVGRPEEEPTTFETEIAEICDAFYGCDLCGECFYFESNMLQHKQIHLVEHNVNQQKRRRNGTRVSTIDSELADVSTITCKVCSQKFTALNSLKNHLRIHTGEKPYQCDVCDKSFAQASGLTSHRRIHTGEKPYNCTICNKWFSTSCQLSEHTRYHTGVKAYACETCNRRFHTSSLKRRHERIHTGANTVLCSVCAKRFTTKFAKERHEKTHFIEKFSCELCPKKFKLQEKLDTHLSNEHLRKPHTCSKCYRNFAKPVTLQNHVCPPKGSKPGGHYPCKAKSCSKIFLFESSLTTHLKMSHPGEKVHECVLCDQRFVTKRLLRRHTNSCHPTSTHDWFSCLDCSVKFRRPSSLKLHRRVRHPSRKNFYCDICKWSFGSLKSLENHVSTHLEDNIYKNFESDMLETIVDADCCNDVTA